MDIGRRKGTQRDQTLLSSQLSIGSCALVLPRRYLNSRSSTAFTPRGLIHALRSFVSYSISLSLWTGSSIRRLNIPLSPPGSPANIRRAARRSTWARNGLRSKRPGFPRLRQLQIVGGPGSRRGRPHRCARVRRGAHGAPPGRGLVS